MDGKESVAKWLMLVGFLFAATTLACNLGEGQDNLPTPRDRVETNTSTATALLSEATVAPASATTPQASIAPDDVSPPSTAATVASEPVTYTRGDDACVRLEPALGGGPGQDPLVDIAAREAVLQRLEGHTRPPVYATFSADGQTVLTADLESIRIWRSATGQLQHVITLEDVPISSLAPSLSPDGALLATAYGEGVIRLWDVASGSAVRDISVSSSSPRLASSFADHTQFVRGGELIAVAMDRVIVLVDVETGQKMQELAGEIVHVDTSGLWVGNGHAGGITSLVYSPNTDALFSSGAEGTVWLWNYDTGEAVRCYDAETYIEEIAISPDGRTLVALLGSQIVFWDAVDGTLLERWQAPAIPDIEAFAASSTGRWDTTRFSSLDYRSDGASFVVALQDQTARIFDAQTRSLVGVMRHPRPVNWAEFSPDGSRIVVAMGSYDDLAPDPIYEAWIWDATHRDLTLAANAQNLVQPGISAAVQGDRAGALAAFSNAQALNPYAQFDLSVDGQARATLALVEQAAIAALEPDPETALSYLEAAQGMSTAPQVDLRAAARVHIGNALNAAVQERAREGDIDGAFVALATMQAFTPEAQVWPATFNSLCRYGSLWGRVRDVYFSCDLAVASASFEGDQARYRDSRGIARALAGDEEGAIEDFQAYVVQFFDQSAMADDVARRQEWIDALSFGNNPFDAALVETLRMEATH